MVAIPGSTLAQSDEDQAAGILYESGRDAFKADRFEEALVDLRKAYSLVKNRYLRFYLGLTLERLARCGEARPFLESLSGELNGEQESLRRGALANCLLSAIEHAIVTGDCTAANDDLGALEKLRVADLAGRRTGLVGRCEVAKAWPLARSDRCDEALATLARTPGPAGTEVQSESEAIASHCRQAHVGFAPSTASQHAAFVLAEEGLLLERKGNPTAAAGKFEKALVLFEEPHLRMHAARTRFAGLDCAGAVGHADAAMKGAPELAHDARRIRTWCATFNIDAAALPDVAVRRRMMARYLELAPWEGTVDLEGLSATLSNFDNPRVRLFVARSLSESQRYVEALNLLRNAGEWPESLRAEASAELDRARFGSLDPGAESGREERFQTYAEARAELDRGLDREAEVKLAAIAGHPMVARYLAELAGARGDCERVDALMESARSDPALPPGWATSVSGKCRELAAQQAKARQDQEQSERLAEERKRLAIRQGASYALMGLGAACIATSGYLFYRYFAAVDSSHARMNEYNASTDPVEMASLRGRVAAAHKDARASSGAGYGMVGLGAGLVTWGVVWYFESRGAKGRAPSVMAVPVVSTDAVGVVLSRSF
jgi:tetratricopeptide (TPR) repeat protein